MTRKIYTALIIIIILLISIFIQINLLNVVPLFGIKANLGIIMIIGFGFMNGKLVGGLTGAFYGMMMDILFSKVIGINIMLYILIGLIAGQISSKFSKDNKTAMSMIVVILTVLFELLSYLLISIFQFSDTNIISAIIVITIEAMYNFLITVIIHKFIVALGDFINRSKNSYYLL